MKQVRLDKGALVEGNQSSYKVISKIGSGGFGNIYKAIKPDTSEIVAVKTLKHNSFTSAVLNKKRIRRFEHEIDICAQMSHTNIIQLKDRGDIGLNEPFAVFEYIKGNTLKDILLKKGGLRAHDVKDIMSQVLFAIKHMHSKGVVHRDLKPQNIMIEESGGKVVLLDFGISTSLNNRFGDKIGEKRAYEKCGTPAYAIPNQLMGGRVGFYNDIYAWGLILIECFTGYPVARGRHLRDVFQQRISKLGEWLPFHMANTSLASLLTKVFNREKGSCYSIETILKEFIQIDFSSIINKCGPARPENIYTYTGDQTLVFDI